MDESLAINRHRSHSANKSLNSRDSSQRSSFLRMNYESEYDFKKKFNHNLIIDQKYIKTLDNMKDRSVK